MCLQKTHPPQSWQSALLHLGLAASTYPESTLQTLVQGKQALVQPLEHTELQLVYNEKQVKQ